MMLDNLPNSAYHNQEVFMDRENVIANTRAGGGSGESAT